MGETRYMVTLTTVLARMDGSFAGGLDHAEALRGAGYEVAR